MFFKSLAAAGMTALTVASFAAPAEAKTKLYLQFGDPGYENCQYINGRLRCRDDRTYFVDPIRPRPRHLPRYDDGYGDDDGDYDGRLSCNDARQLLRERGYRRIVVQNCDSRAYSFSARKDGRRVSVRVNSYTGQIRVRRPDTY